MQCGFGCFFLKKKMSDMFEALVPSPISQEAVFNVLRTRGIQPLSISYGVRVRVAKKDVPKMMRAQPFLRSHAHTQHAFVLDETQYRQQLILSLEEQNRLKENEIAALDQRVRYLENDLQLSKQSVQSIRQHMTEAKQIHDHELRRLQCKIRSMLTNSCDASVYLSPVTSPLDPPPSPVMKAKW